MSTNDKKLAMIKKDVRKNTITNLFTLYITKENIPAISILVEYDFFPEWRIVSVTENAKPAYETWHQ